MARDAPLQLGLIGLEMAAGPEVLAPKLIGEGVRLATEGTRVVTNGAEDTTTLWRAVKPAELEDVNKTGALRNLGDAEGKYFSTTPEGASSYAKQAVKAFGDEPYTVVSTTIPTKAITSEMKATVDRGVPAVVVPNGMLPGLVPKVEPTMVIPPRLPK